MRRKGFTLAEIMIVVGIIALLAALAIPNMLRARLVANEATAIAGLRTIVSAAHTFRASGNINGFPQNLSVLVTHPPYIDTVLGSGKKQGYLFNLTGTSTQFTATAEPEFPGRTGTRFFFVDTSGVIRASEAGPANSTNDPLA